MGFMGVHSSCEKSRGTWWGGQGTCNNVGDLMQENVGYNLFKTHNIYIVLRYPFSKCESGIMYNVQCGLSRIVLYC